MGTMMDDNDERASERGKAGYALLWLLGVPLPILLVFYVLRGCN